MTDNDSYLTDVAVSESSEHAFAEMNLDELHSPRSTEFSSATNYGLAIPQRQPTVERRRAYADGENIQEAEPVSDVGAQSFSANTITVQPSGTAAAMNPGQMLLGDHPRRQRVLVSNGHSLDSVLIGMRSDVESGGGFSLPALNTVELTVTTGLYAAIVPGNDEPVPVGVWAEYA